jgi:hypothetical protein
MNKITYVITGMVALAALMAMSTMQNVKADWSNSNGWCGYDKNGKYQHDYSCGDVTIKKAKKVSVDNSIQKTCEALCFNWIWDWDWNTVNTHDTYKTTYNSYDNKKKHNNNNNNHD